MIGDDFNFIRNADFLQIRTFRECIWVDRLNMLRQSDRFKIRAVLKCVGIDFGDGIRNIDRRDIAVGFKGAEPDAGDAVRNADNVIVMRDGRIEGDYRMAPYGEDDPKERRDGLSAFLEEMNTSVL